MSQLPREAYTTKVWQDAENNELFGHSWVFAGLESDIPNEGDYLTHQTGNSPLAVIRQKDGSLKAYHNICRHRGTTLLEGQNNTNKGNTGKSIVCPYHRWTYVLDGRLKGAPDMATCFPDLDRANLGLKPAAIGVFQGLLFVNPNPSENFENWIAPITDKAWPHDLGAKDIYEAATLIYDLKCDWKVFVENAIDGYHLAYLHEDTLGGPKPSENIWEKHGEHLLWYATDDGDMRHALPVKARKDYKKYWTKPISAAKAPDYAGVYHLFPSTIIAATPYSFSISSLKPSGVGTSELSIRHWVGPQSILGQSKDDRKYIPGFNPKTGRISSENWTKPALETGDFQTEDVWICEKLQKGLFSPAYECGPLAKGVGAEDPIAWFHETLFQAFISPDIKHSN